LVRALIYRTDMEAFPGGVLLLPSLPVPGVTTVIPVFNGEQFLPATLASVAAQTRLPDRLVVIDDCSTDRTGEVAAAFLRQNPRLNGELLRNERNQGLFGNLNRCLDLAAGTDLLHILLADDLVLPRFLEQVVPTLDSAAAPSMAWSLTEKIDAAGDLLPGQRGSSGGPARPLSADELLRRQGQLRTVFCGSVLLKTGRHPAPCRFPLDYPQVGDCVFYADWARRSEQRIEVPQVLCRIRHHAASTTSANARRLQSWVGDEWRAMTQIAAWSEAGPLQKRLWRERIRCLFAARSVVKQQLVRPTDPVYAEEIGRLARGAVPALHWSLGKAVVCLRDLIQGPHPR